MCGQSWLFTVAQRESLPFARAIREEFDRAYQRLRMVTAAMKSEDDCFLVAMINLDSVLKSREITLLPKSVY